jgi:hypothetical protein
MQTLSCFDKASADIEQVIKMTKNGDMVIKEDLGGGVDMAERWSR